ncbi:MAG TPA: AmmeMemoRadiSam system protein B [Candidatus Aminicenantes bacterium]|nr:AmmeMemoRadiSam system protein B [Candidatus Aminicenantes bacterium]
MKVGLRMFVALLLAFLCPRPSVCADVRGYLTTGSWYPEDPQKLNQLLDRCLRGVRPRLDPATVQGLVVPHAGLVHSGAVAAQGYMHLQGRTGIRRVILLGVSHSGRFSGACVSSFAFNSTPLGKIPVDREVVNRLEKEPKFRVNNRVMQQEHSLENQLPFLQRVLAEADFKVVPILFGRATPAETEAMAAAIAPYVDEHTVVVASSDLTHYGSRFGYSPFKKDVAGQLHRLDRGLLEKVVALDHREYWGYLERTGMTMCGVVPVAVWMHLFDKRSHELKTVAYATSGDANKDYTLSVGYGTVAAVRKKSPEAQLSAKEGAGLLTIARRTLESALNGRENSTILQGVELTPAMKRKTGVFVTLRKGHALRGCIGSIVGTRPLFDGVMANARNAAFADPRFPNLKASELDSVNIEVSVMTPLQPIRDYRAIRLGTDGVIIRKNRASAVYLPQVATETGWDLDTFLSSLCRKAGLSSRAYRSTEMEFLVFQAQVFAEEEK